MTILDAMLGGLTAQEQYGMSPLAQGTMVPQQRNWLQRLGGRVNQGLQNADPMMLMALGSNILGAQGIPTPTKVSPMARLGMGMQNAVPQMMGLKQMQMMREQQKAGLEHQQQVYNQRLQSAKTLYDTLHKQLSADGEISQQDQVILERAKMGIADPMNFNADALLRDVGAYLEPEEQKPLSTIAKARQDLTSGLITPEEFNQIVAGVGRPLAETTTNVNIDGGPKLPANYMWKDPADVSQGVVPIPGGPAETRPIEGAGKETMLDVAAAQIPDLRSYIFNQDGSPNRQNIALMTGKEGGIPLTSGRKPAAQMEVGIQAITRIETGAAMPPEEVRNTRRRFQPSILDSNDAVTVKMEMYEDFLSGNLKLIRKGRGGEPEFDSAAFDAEFQRRMSGAPEPEATSEGVVDWSNM